MMTRSQLLGVFLGGVLVGASVTWWIVRPRPAAHDRGAQVVATPSALTPAPASAPTMVPGEPVERPNVVLVIVCTLRKDQLSFYGGHPAASPFLAGLAEQGAVFDDAYDAAPWTKAASTAIMTGHHAVQVGMVEPGTGSNRRRLADEVNTLAEAFDGAGYWTIGLTANPNTNAVFGFHQGFDDYVEATDLWRSGMVKVSGRKVASLALEAVDRRSDPESPLYLRMMILDPHEPIKVSARDARAFRDDDTPARIARYRAMVARMDEAVEDLWVGLEERGFDRSNTVLALINDHGEGLSFPRHHGIGHGNLTFSSTVSMPWLVYGAGIAQHHRIGGVASQIDVMPTLLGLAGVEGYDGPGRDWSAQARGAARTDLDAAYVDTWFQGASRAAVYTPEVSCHRDFRTPEQLGDKVRKLSPLACYAHSDPYQRSELPAVDDPAVAMLDTWRAERLEEYEAFPFKADALMSRAMKDQLEALGYIDADNEVPLTGRGARAAAGAELADTDVADTDVDFED
ncbi:MAG: arylsulfatase A-like enzyme [Myxococcota bacterium]